MAQFQPKDITGKRFGKLTALHRTPRKTKGGAYIWLCECECGNCVDISIDNLRENGGTQSCGCSGREKRQAASEARKQQKKVEKEAAKAQRRLNSFVDKFNSKYGEFFEYIGGYPDMVITIRCKRCGYERDRGRVGIFVESNVSCPKCGNNRAESGTAAVCVKCGAIFMQYTPVQEMCAQCHDEAERAKMATRKRIREARATQNGKVDYSITLTKLIERDNHACAICGREVNEKDYTFVGDAFIAGNDYPSIDHIIPLSKGGLHQWDNVQLAHRLCNSIKCDKV